MPDEQDETQADDGYSDGPDWMELGDKDADYYVAPAERERYRKHFLEAVEELAPVVLQRLSKLARLNPGSARKYSNVQGSPLEQWGANSRLYHLDSGAGGWILIAAERTLKYWANLPEVPTPLRWSPDAARVDLAQCGPYGPPSRRERESIEARIKAPLRFDCPAWEPNEESSLAYLERVKAQFESELRVELDRVESSLRYTGSKRAPRKKKDPDHFRWMVLYQVCRVSYIKIAADFSSRPGKEKVDRRSVSPSIDLTAKLLFGRHWEFWRRLRRPSPPGVPVPRTRALASRNVMIYCNTRVTTK